MKLHVGNMFNLFDAHRSEDEADRMTAYMLNKFPHFGIKAKPRRELSKKHNANFTLEATDFLTFAKICYAYPEREMHHYCLDTLHAFKKQFSADTLKISEYLVLNNSWWDTVDTVNTLISLPVFKKNRELQFETAMKWSKADNLWLRRSAIISQLKFRLETDTELLQAVIESNLGSDEFFINKAIGWALREYGNYNPEWVLSYVKKINLNPLSYREAVRKII
jgi:3-methyladenine DNA glycosylase AlkD